MQPIHWLIYTTIFILGVFIGSFLNVCIYRIPKKEDIVVERSHCMSCGHVLNWYELIPIFSFLIQGGKCRKCKTKLSLQYPIIEALNGLLWLLIVIRWGLTWNSVIFCVVVSTLIVIAVIDWRTYEIPFGCNIVIGIAGIARVLLDYRNWLEYFLGLIVISGILLLIALASKGKAMGGGDIKMMAATGLLLGWKLNIIGFVTGCIIGSIMHIIRMKVSKEGHQLAFGPYLATGTYIAILLGDFIWNWYMGFFSF